MDDTYDIIADADYNFGTFIAGPSKTADIEQSLVLGLMVQNNDGIHICGLINASSFHINLFSIL